ncbi:rhodanese-like domain-containing protein [Aliiglaciecola sp. LCG003]|uniref:rhodanese-like domain-containing protein n=1 Tax=Aliiglaciecola sp. LCG003 TaxID=3053655 RepID=UPI0025738CE8|nr:rhodanese-like domain-containing protein [Aliiglaciecola sp. LCG003]WJG08422.1 rhodanese-like domain-containing protein [Aliiglaciecola sp. LCG003]
MSSVVTRIPAGQSDAAKQYFSQLLSFETDCWDVHFAQSNSRQDFVLLDVRNAQLYAQGHLPHAINIAHKQLSVESLSHFPDDTVFVVYCAGPHCNGADKAAVKLADLSRPVKKMIGGVTGWLDEGLSLVVG